jgi:hypothetical protein
VIWTLTNLKFYHDLDIEKRLHVKSWNYGPSHGKILNIQIQDLAKFQIIHVLNLGPSHGKIL